MQRILCTWLFSGLDLSFMSPEEAKMSSHVSTPGIGPIDFTKVQDRWFAKRPSANVSATEVHATLDEVELKARRRL
jgi:hypothetical protein